LVVAALLSGVTGAARAAETRFDDVPDGKGRELERRLLAPSPRIATEEELSHARELREFLGFRADREYVRSLHARPVETDAVEAESSDLAGLVMTRAEAKQMALRNYLQLRSHVVERWARAYAPERYAGYYMAAGAAPSGTLLYVRFVDATRGDLLAARAQLPGVLRSSVEIEDAEESLAELEVRADTVDAVLAPLREQGLTTGLDLDEREGRISVFVAPEHADRADEVRRLITDERVAIEFGEDAPTWLKNETYTYGLVVGGQLIRGPNYDDYGQVQSFNCTSGFAAYGYYGPFMLTAGHCYLLNGMTYQGSLPLGPVKALNGTGINASFDAALISTYGYRVNWGRVHVNKNDFAHQITGATPLDGDKIGDLVCSTGATSTGVTGLLRPNTRCGAVTERQRRPSYFPQAARKYRVANVTSLNGDSGGAVYWDTIFGYLATGLVSGCTAAIDKVCLTYPDSRMIYSHLPYALATWGLTLNTN
jgi:DNA-binding transcriptional ArsR family regulator